jgi:hypothetical protein
MARQRFLREAAMRARYPDVEGFIERGGVKVGYEVFGQGEPAVVFPPTDPIVSSRAWKAQIPAYPFYAATQTDEGWAKDTRDSWLRDWRGYAEFFFGELAPEPHSTKQHEDCVGCATTSSRTSTSGTGWPSTAPAGA